MSNKIEEMLARYRILLANRGFDWGDEWESAAKYLLRYVNWFDAGRFSKALDEALREAERPVPLKELKAVGSLADPVSMVVHCLADPLPSFVAVADLNGIRVRNPLPFVLSSSAVSYTVFCLGVDNQLASVIEAEINAESTEIEIFGYSAEVVEPIESGRIRLVADDVSRWSVEDDRGCGWFPVTSVRRFDWDNRAYFHGNDVIVEVPRSKIKVTVSRGCEFKSATIVLDMREESDRCVELSPERIYDAAERGWYGGDLHVHLNYSGDYVCVPEEAALAQQGEGLHLMNLLAANCSTSLVYDREGFEEYAGQNLPWSNDDHVACWGVEYRNDMLGHFTVLNARRPLARYQTGHTRSEEPYDWPPNSVAAADARDAGGTVTYTHPMSVEVRADGTADEVFAPHRARVSDARELVIDAALGLVDSVDLGVPAHVEGVESLYHRLLGCGLRLAATAGSDAMLSQSRHWAHSNPPGWVRAYADLGGSPLSVPRWQEALRAGRTFATNGPWLEFRAAGSGLGETVLCDAPRTIDVHVRTVGIGIEELSVIGPEGEIVCEKVGMEAESAEMTATIDIEDSTWLAAVARGGQNSGFRGSRPTAYAHTSPIWIEIGGRPVGRREDASWCLNWVHRFEQLARTKGKFASTRQWEELTVVIDQARNFYSRIAR